jgi:hypothetical protein
MAQTESWHLNKSVPITLIIGLAIQAAGVIWMFSSMRSDIDNNQERLTKVETHIRQIETVAQAQAVQLGRIETRLDALMDQSDKMIDPLTALSVAASAVSNAQTLIAAGRDATSALAKFAGAVSDVNYAAEKAKNPSIWKSLTGSAEAEAIEIFAAQKKIEQMKRDVETLIGFTYGQKGLEEYKDTLRRVRVQRQKTAYRKEEIKDALITWTLGTLIVLAGVAGLAVLLYVIGRNQGKW